jgi:hypothetical protein
MIRKGRLEEIDDIIKVGTRLLERSNNADIPVCRLSVFNAFREFIRRPDKALLVAVHDDCLTGLLMVAAEPFWWDDQRKGRRYVTDWCFYSERYGDGLKMLDIATAWAWALPRVVEVNIARNFQNAEVSADAMFAIAGFERVGAMYTAKKPIQENEGV